MSTILVVNLTEFIETLSPIEKANFDELYGPYTFNAISSIADLYVSHIDERDTPQFRENVFKHALGNLEAVVDDFHNNLGVHSLNADVVANALTRGVETFHKQYGKVIDEQLTDSLRDNCVVVAKPIHEDTLIAFSRKE